MMRLEPAPPVEDGGGVPSTTSIHGEPMKFYESPPPLTIFSHLGAVEKAEIIRQLVDKLNGFRKEARDAGLRVEFKCDQAFGASGELRVSILQEL
jgi:hypothetical protein